MKALVRYILLMITILALAPSVAEAQDQIFLQGVVKESGTDKPLTNVTILTEDYLVLTNTDQDGKFSGLVNRKAKLTLNATGYNDLEFKVGNQAEIVLYMVQKSVEMEEVTVTVKAKLKVVPVEPTELEVKGNYLHIKPRFRVPKHLFSSYNRFIFQPVLTNLTRGTEEYYRPVVIDGRVMTINDLRASEFDVEDDPLRDYILDYDFSGDADDLYAYTDSLYIADKEILNEDLKVDCYLNITDVFARDGEYRDTLVIANGTVNPLRFFDYNLNPMELNDTTLIPKPEKKLMSEVGTSNIKFVVGRAQIDDKDPNNQIEFDQINEKLTKLLNDPYTTLSSIAVTGYASPEGNYASNRSLAAKRTSLILDKMASVFTSDQRARVKLTSNSEVVRWSQLVTSIASTDPELASKIDGIVKQYKDDYNGVQVGLRRLPEYRKKIIPDYLPALRKVEYALDYSHFRNLTDAEIVERYKSGTKDMSRFEFWRLVDSAEDKDRAAYEDAAIKSYPNFTLVANRVALRLLEKDSLNMDILAPCLDRNAPLEIIHNQAVMAIGLRELEVADSLVSLLPDDERFDYIRSVGATFTGDYETAFKALQPMGGLNEVLLLMCMKHNKEAYEAAKVLAMDPANAMEAKVWYIMAACANRVDDLGIAMMALSNAFMYDPALLEIAKVDGDMEGLVELVAPEDGGEQTDGTTAETSPKSKKKRAKSKAPKEKKPKSLKEAK